MNDKILDRMEEQLNELLGPKPEPNDHISEYFPNDEDLDDEGFAHMA